MSDAVEAVVASDASGQQWSIGVWDIRNGSQLTSYKGGGSCNSKALAYIGDDYIVAGDSSKPVLNVWLVNKGEPRQELRTVCPAVIGCLAVSPDGHYLVAGIAEKLHVWQVESGKLMAVAARHFQNVTCVQFISDGTHFVSGGDDGMVLVWDLNRLIANDSARPDPSLTFSDHFLAVKDIFVGNGGDKCRIASVSTDGACKIYDFSSGKMLLSVMVEPNLTAVTGDVCESSLFLGTQAGDIYCLDLRSPPREQECHLSEGEKEMSFRGHSKAITCLSVSQDSITLLSGSSDETIRLWHISSRQCVRTIQLKGAVTNAFIKLFPAQSFSEKLEPNVVMHRLQRSNNISDSSETSLEMLVSSDLNDFPDGEDSDIICDVHSSLDTMDSTSEIPRERAKELGVLKKRNAELYKFATEKLLSQVHNFEIVSTHVNTELALQHIESKTILPKPIPSMRKPKNKGKKRNVMKMC